jgi:hypothetical protein
MLSSFRFAAILTVIFAVCGPTRAQEIAPAGSGVSIYKSVFDNGPAHTVKYYVTGGSARLQAMVRRIEWAENELSVVEQLQRLKLDTVVNERRVAAFRTDQLTNPFYPPGFILPPIAPVDGGYGASPLQKSLGRQLAWEATPESALQLIGFLELVQTELEAELKTLPKEEQKAAQPPINALRQRVAALPHGDAPAPRPQPVAAQPVAAQPVVPQPVVAQPVVPQQVWGFSPVYQRQIGITGPVAAPARATGAIEVEWGGKWWAAEILRVSGSQSLIHYTGWDSSWDEWVPASRIRPACPVSAPPPPVSVPLATAATQPTALQEQDRLVQQILQMQQQIARQQPLIAGRLK